MVKGNEENWSEYVLMSRQVEAYRRNLKDAEERMRKAFADFLIKEVEVTNCNSKAFAVKYARSIVDELGRNAIALVPEEYSLEQYSGDKFNEGLLKIYEKFPIAGNFLIRYTCGYLYVEPTGDAYETWKEETRDQRVASYYANNSFTGD